MPFGWGDFLTLAGELAQAPSDALTEARGRSAVSRAYYSAFRRALVVFDNRNVYRPSRRADDHSGLIRALFDTKRTDYVSVGKALERLLAARRTADYDLEQNRQYKMTPESAIAQAARVIELLGQLLSP